MSLRETVISRRKLFMVLLSLTVVAASCNRQQEKPQAAQDTFASPDEAGNALAAATKSGNGEAVEAVLGPGSKEVMSAGDAARDKADMAGFASDYDVMHRWRKLPNGSEVLITGSDNTDLPSAARAKRLGPVGLRRAGG